MKPVTELEVAYYRGVFLYPVVPDGFLKVKVPTPITVEVRRRKGMLGSWEAREATRDMRLRHHVKGKFLAPGASLEVMTRVREEFEQEVEPWQAYDHKGQKVTVEERRW
jgi:hypothetical protein